MVTISLSIESTNHHSYFYLWYLTFLTVGRMARFIIIEHLEGLFSQLQLVKVQQHERYKSLSK